MHVMFSITDVSFHKHTCMGLAGLVQQVVTLAVWRARVCTSAREEVLNTFTLHPEHTNNLLQGGEREGGGRGRQRTEIVLTWCG